MSKTAPIVYLNGSFVDLKEARVSLLDQGLLRGDGLFETIRGRGGKVPLASHHLERLYAAARVVGLETPITAEKLGIVLEEILKRNKLPDARLRVVFTRGVGESMDPIGETTTPTYFVLAEALSGRPTKEEYEKGVAAITVPVFSYNGLWPLSVKSTSYFGNMSAKREARKKGAFEAILIDPNGQVSEGSTSNIFWARQGEICTTPLTTGALPGVTRKVIQEILTKEGKKLREETLKKEDLYRLEEAFFSGSIVGILPIASIDGKALAIGKDSRAHWLRAKFESYVAAL